jgi:sporulation integral membrane protein YtvI
MNIVRRYIGIFLNITIPILITVLVCYFGPKLLVFFMPFVIGWVIALIACPLVRFLEKHLKIVRQASSFLIIVGVLAGIVLVLYLVSYRLIQMGIHLVNDAPALYQSISGDFRSALTNLQALADKLPHGMAIKIDEILENLGSSFGELSTEFLSKLTDPTITAAGNVAKSIPNALIYAIVTIMSAYFFLADFDGIMHRASEKLPHSCIRILRLAKKKLQSVVGGYFLAQFKIMVVIAVILTIGFLIMGISYSGLLGFLIAVVDFLPVLGTGTILIPWALLKLINGSYFVGVGLIVLYAVIQVVRQLVQPKLIGDSMGLNPLVTLFLLYIGFKIRGITGMILAVPIGMIFLELCEMGVYQSVIDGVCELLEDIKSLRNRPEIEDEEEKE